MPLGPTHLIIGASRGLGQALTKALLSSSEVNRVYATVRSPPKPDTFPKSDKLRVLQGIDVSKEEAGKKIVEGLEKGQKVDGVWIVAGLLVPESFEELKWQAQIDMYTICAIAPVFVTRALTEAGHVQKDSKVILFTSEGGSLALRTLEEGGGMYGHHGSKAASNMAGKLLSLELHDKGVPVLIIHPSFMRTEMTKGAGFSDAWDSGGALHPDEAVPKIISFVSSSGMDRSGQFWAPNGPGDVGQAENVMGKNLPTPLQLPW